MAKLLFEHFIVLMLENRSFDHLFGYLGVGEGLPSAGETSTATSGSRPNLDELPLDDPETYRQLRAGRTAGVFQFESALATDMLKSMRCDRFDDLVASNALMRCSSAIVSDTNFFPFAHQSGAFVITTPTSAAARIAKTAQPMAQDFFMTGSVQNAAARGEPIRSSRREEALSAFATRKCSQ